MKQIFIIISLSAIILLRFNACWGQEKFPILIGPYLGQNKPGLIPEKFVPDVISTEEAWEACISISPDE